ncbi:S1C family serine protease [Motiliproteus sp. MSK22-1]|uniref:S1C family serine protease n=1 Tax=Motiliproteus sp. MSK22-1 TaxID=1897630 RepID=UPI000977FA6A|nr:Do family serine endopeptidase [Motiliproteus sp. MSK22-1]OMH30351.1 transcriptional regulator [Motiliproteus sp. MSK22-1]
MRKLTTFIIWPVIAGILVAFTMLVLFPQWNAPSIQTVQINQVQSKALTAPLRSGPVSYAEAVNNAAPAVVNIYTSTRVRQKTNPLMEDPLFKKFFDMEQMPQRERIQSSLGSGVIFSSQGYVLTNNHVIEGADTIVVALKDGRESQAEVIGTDPETDLAVLSISLEDLPAVTLASSDDIAVGDVVLAIGNPFGVGQTVTMGIISATGRNQLGINTFENFIQTDAAINPGNSGGALIDAYGNLLGINTAIFSRSGGSQGIGFAIPSNLARKVLQEIIENGRVVRGWLGIEIQELTPRLAESFGIEDRNGLIIAGIFRNSPAHQAGMQPGDILLSIDGAPIVDSRSAMNQIAQTKPGIELRMEVLRNDKTESFQVLIGDRPPSRR